MKFRWTLIACLALLTGCGKNIPSNIIQPQKMENVLYDYHLSMAMSGNMKNTEKEAHKNYIFQKYGITKAEFDSSMVWYTRESKELYAIYTKLDKRLAREYSHVERLLESRKEYNNQKFESGDTVNIWKKDDILWFSKKPLYEKLTFTLVPDSTFHPKDAFSWDMDYCFMEKGKAIMAMSVIYTNDSVIGYSKEVSESGPQNIYIHTDSAFQAKTIHGFIYVPEDSINDPKILIHNISMTRYHMPEPKDSLASDATMEGEVKKETPKKKEAPVIQEKPRKIKRDQSIQEKKKPRNIQMQEEEVRE